MNKKKVVYIAGPITGVPQYYKAFEQAEDELTALGYIPLSPARLPEGMTSEQYMRICFAMIDAADAVLFLAGFTESAGANIEFDYCEYTGKPIAYNGEVANESSEVRLAFIKKELEEALK